MFEAIKKMRMDGWLVFFVSFVVSLVCICPTIYPGDSSLMAAASFSLGSAHPPGYPLFVIVGKLLTLLSLGNVAFKVNLVSALSGALACFMVFQISMEITESRPASWAAALICGMSPIFFAASLNAKGGVYTLNSFMSMCVFLLGIRIIKGRDVFRNSLLAFFLIGLGMGNHQTIGLMGLIILLPLAMRWRDLSVRWALLGILFFLSGLSVYLFIYLRSMALVDHGGLILYSHAWSFKDLARVFFRQAYAFNNSSSTQALEQTFSNNNVWLYGLRNSAYYVALLSVKPVVVFLLIGLAVLTKRPKLFSYFVFSGIVWLLLLGKLVFSGALLTISNIEIVSVYFLPVVPILYCIIAVGFAATLSFIRKRQWSFVARVGTWVLVALPFAFLPYPLGLYNLNSNFLAYNYGRDMLMSLPQESLIMEHGDNSLFTTFYMKGVERIREDVLAIGTGGNKSVFGLECAPQWKYDKLYPKFYHGSNSSISEINDEFALKGKLFIDNSLDLTDVVARFYDYYPYVLSAALWPKNLPAAEFQAGVRNRFKSAYERVNYESVLAAIPSSYYHMSQELLTRYSLSTLFYSDFIMREGDLRDGEAFQKMAFIMAPAKVVLWPYVSFLLKDGRKDHAFSLLARMKTTKRYGDIASIVEEKALSVIGDNDRK